MGENVVIKRIRAWNFKSFRDIDLELGNLNLIIGANASGKSNFIEIIKFIRDLGSFGVANSIRMHGGPNHIRNINLTEEHETWIELTIEGGFDLPMSSKEAENDDANYGEIKDRQSGYIGFYGNNATYRITLHLGDDPSGLRTVTEQLVLDGEFYEYGPNLDTGDEVLSEDEARAKAKELYGTGQGSITLNAENGQITTSLVNEERDDIDFNRFVRDLLPNIRMSRMRDTYEAGGSLFGALVSTTPERMFLPYPISTFDFDPKVLKHSARFEPNVDLKEDGSNLSVFIRQVMKDQDRHALFVSAVKSILEFVNDIGSRDLEDGSVLTFVKDDRTGDVNLGSPFISDGTLSVLAIVMALYFQDSPLIIFEEPERNLHPKLIPGLVTVMSEMSGKKQIILTTHNPEFVKWMDLSKMVLVYRDRGISRIVRPLDLERVQLFLENEMGIEEIFVNNRFGV